MAKASITVSADFVLADLDRRIFGNFIEQMGRQVYGGIYEPGHPTADERGFRRDVIELVRELGVSIVRYPGGNQVSGYDWKKGVGPRERRPRTLDLSRYCIETNQIGTNEFIDWCRVIGVEPMLAINLGTGTFDDARAYVEYCNHPPGSAWSDLRVKHGYAEPHNVGVWCLGNEPDGWWQIAAHSAESYAWIASETAKGLKRLDPNIELVVAGSSGRQFEVYGPWERTALEAAYEHVEFLAAHIYFRNPHGTTADYLANCELMDTYIKEMAAMADAVGAKKRSRKRMMISFDEWNIAAQQPYEEKRAKPGTWPEVIPVIEDVYSFEDALLIGGAMQVLINNADRVKVACFAQLVNCIAPIMTVDGGPAWRQTIFWPLSLTARYGRGQVLKQIVSSPTFATKDWGEAPCLLSTVTHDPATGRTAVFALNRSLTDPLDLTVNLRGLGQGRMIEAALQLVHSDLKATNSPTNPDRVRPANLPGAKIEGETLVVQFAPASWNVICLANSRNGK